MMKCYLINLDASTDRLSRFNAANGIAGFEVVRISGVDGRTMSPESQQAYRANTKGPFHLGGGMIGCFLSHRKAWQYVVDGAEPWAFVCEDDAVFTPNCEALFRDADWLTGQMDIVKAETVLQKVEVGCKPIAQVGPFAVRKLKSHHRGGAGYFINTDSAKRLLELSEEFCDPPDDVLFDPALGIAPHFRIFQIDPAICIQEYKLGGEYDSMTSSPVPLPGERLSFGFAKVCREFVRILRGVRHIVLSVLGISDFKKISYNPE
tara:strand:- start:24127 stop:24915 length:789 start_codon:yes stop_codon:yes gene_type:complete